MPELPEVETIRRSLTRRVRGSRVVRVDVSCRALRRPLPPGFEKELTGRRIVGARRRAKYLLFDLDDGRSWIVHLGMSGRLLYAHSRDGRMGDPHEHVHVALDDGATLVFHDPRRFGLMTVEDARQSPLLIGIGPEPFDRRRFHAAYLAELRRRTKRTVKDVLMDQRVVAGLGNIYVNELLFVAGVRPRRRLPRLSRTQCARIVEATRTVLRDAIRHRGTSISDFLDGIGRPGGYQWRRRVYDRANEPCTACGSPIRAVVVGQRSSFYCPRCQR